MGKFLDRKGENALLSVRLDKLNELTLVLVNI